MHHVESQCCAVSGWDFIQAYIPHELASLSEVYMYTGGKLQSMNLTALCMGILILLQWECNISSVLENVWN
jgi:hypothetical protein